MKKIGYTAIFCLFILGVKGQNSAEEAQITAKATDYLQAWYQGDSELMLTTIHPQMAKKIVFDTGFKNGALAFLSAQDLLSQTKKKRPEFLDREQLASKIKVLDAYRNTATVKVDANNWIDYLHMAKISGEWKIVNILWELKTEDL